MREIIIEELDRSAAIIMGGAELVPRFRIAVPGDGDHVLLMPLPDALSERQRRMSLVSGYMAWKGASDFVFSTELAEPDAAASIAVSRAVVFGAIRLITRERPPKLPLSLGPPEWLDRSSIGDEIPALLPSPTTTAVGELTRDFGRALRDRVFWLILAAMLLGLFEQSAWFIAPLAVLLTLFSTVSDAHWFELARERGKLLGLWLIWFGCLMQNAMFVGLAFVAGHATRWFWQ